jgi:hypothetical protein
VNYSWGSSSADYTGLTDSGSNSSHSSLSLNSSYSLLGFHVGGAYSESRSQEHTPDLLNLGLPTTGTTDMKAENVTIQRALPLNTQLSAQYSHTDDNYNLFNTPQNEMFDIATASLVSNPIKRLTLSGSVSYNSNLSAQILSQVASSVAGGTGTGVTTTTAGQSLLSTGRSLGFNENASYDVGHGLYVLASASHETSHVTGSEDLYTDEYLGGLSYSRALFGGTLGLSYTPGYEVFRVGGSVLVLDQSGSVVPVTMTSRGMIQAGSASYSRHLGRWQAQGTFNYSQSDVNATFLSAFLSRSISGTIRATTRLRNQWNLTVNAMASDGTVPGLSGNRTEMFGGQISNRTWSLSVQDQLNSGYSVLTAAGITSVSLPAIASGLLPNETLTDSSGLSVSISYRRRALSVVSTFTDSSAKLHAVAGPIDTGSKNFDNRVIYRFRKVDIQGGYRWYSQMASSNGLLNQSYQTYWIGIVRQFHAF